MRESYFYGHGKLLLTGEYFVLDGAKSVALPTKLGQRMYVSYKRSNNPKLYWKSFDNHNKCWFETSFELWHFDPIDNETEESKILQTILREARKQNIHFLREEYDVYVETVLEFPLNWGLGSSSTLIYNIAQWAYISPFALHKHAFGGSGYDIACAQSMGPITYQLLSNGPNWETTAFNPIFKDNLYFVYSSQKQNTRDAIKRYRELAHVDDSIVERITQISEEIQSCLCLKEFEDLIVEHENIVSKALDLPRIKDEKFSDYFGEIKSLGAWGGDFLLVTSDKSTRKTKEYFQKRGHDTVFTFDEIILQNFQKFGVIPDLLNNEESRAEN